MGNHSIQVILKLGLAMAASMILTGCMIQAKQETVSDEKTTIVTIWTKDRHDAAYQEARVNEYNESNPDNIRVEYRIYSDNYAQALSSAFQSNSAPDIMAYTDQVFNQFYAQDHFADIIPYMDQELKETFQNVMIDGVNMFDGKCYFIPVCATTPRLFYNKTLFQRAGIEEPPETMEEMIEDAQLITSLYSDEGIYGFAANMNHAQSALERSLMAQANREIGIKTGYDFKNGTYDFTGYEQIIQSWRTLLSEECAFPQCELLDIDPLRELFAEGKIGMYISYIHSEAGVYQEQFPMSDEWDCAEIPTSGGMLKGAQNYSLNNGYLFNKNSEHMDAAWNAYCALFSDLEYQKEYYMRGYGISVIPEVIQQAEEAGYEPKSQMLLLGIHDKRWPKTPLEENPEAVRVEGQDLYEVFKRLIFGKEEILPALEELTERYNEAYQTGIRNHVGRNIGIEDFNSMNPELTVGEQK